MRTSHKAWLLAERVAALVAMPVKARSAIKKEKRYCVKPSCGAGTGIKPKLPDGIDIVVLRKQVVQATLDASGAQGLSPTLNNVGNRIGGGVKDTSTVLTRNISRTFDALNRLQTVAGAAQ